MSTQCPTCYHNNGLEESLQGVLGDQAQLRCRDCGSWFSVPVYDLPTLDCYDEFEARGLEGDDG